MVEKVPEKRVLLLSPKTFAFDRKPSGWRDTDDGIQVFVAQGRDLDSITDPIGTAEKVWSEAQEAFPVDLAIVFLDRDEICLSVGNLVRWGVPPDKVIFVFCSCGEERKRDILTNGGYRTSYVINCDCGGHGKMGEIFKQAMLGILP